MGESHPHSAEVESDAASESGPRRRRAPLTEADAQAFAQAAARLAAENKTEDVVVLDLRGLSSLADFFVLGTGTSERQMHAVLDALFEYARGLGRRPLSVADSSRGTWLLADYVDVVVHLFDEEHRAYYDLDGLWGDAPRVAWDAPDGGPGMHGE